MVLHMAQAREKSIDLALIFLQLLRRHHTMNESQATFSHEEVLLQAVLPFDLMLDRKKCVHFLKIQATYKDTPKKHKFVRDAGTALASLVLCEEVLERELFISTSYVRGMEVTLSERLKSLYNIWSFLSRLDSLNGSRRSL